MTGAVASKRVTEAFKGRLSADGNRALSAKNGILIVEFARDYRAAGNDIRYSAAEAGHVRLRPILMTSLSFVIGVMPLLFAGGAGAGARLSLGAAVEHQLSLLLDL